MENNFSSNNPNDKDKNNNNTTNNNNNNTHNPPQNNSSSPSSSSSLSEKINNYVFKYIIIGDSGVGKSCFVHYYLYSKSKANSTQTICVDFSSKNITVSPTTRVRLQIWDTAGQDKFRSVARSYYRGAIGIIILYDITCKNSFSHLLSWLNEAKATARSECSVIVVGNKKDLGDMRDVEEEEAKKFCENNGLMFGEASAMNGEGVKNIFERLTEDILGKINKGKVDPESLESNYSKELGKTILRQQEDSNEGNGSNGCSQYGYC